MAGLKRFYKTGLCAGKYPVNILSLLARQRVAMISQSGYLMAYAGSLDPNMINYQYMSHPKHKTVISGGSSHGMRIHTAQYTTGFPVHPVCPFRNPLNSELCRI